MPGPRLTRKRPRNFTRPGRTYPAPTGRWFRYAVCTFDVPAGVFLSARSDVSAVIFGLGDADFRRSLYSIYRPRRSGGPPHRRPGNPDLGRVLAGAVADVPAVRLPAGPAGRMAVDGVAHFRRLVRAGPLRNAGPGAQRQPGFAGWPGRGVPAALRQFLSAGAHGVFCAENRPEWPHQSP